MWTGVRLLECLYQSPEEEVHTEIFVFAASP